MASDPPPNAGQQERRKGKKREKEISFNQTGLLDTVSRYAAAMAQIISWQHKLLQNKEAEKRIFFSLCPLLFLPPFYIPVPIHHLYWLNILHKVQREDSFFFPARAESYEMQIYQLNSHQVQFEGGGQEFLFYMKNFSLCVPTPPWNLCEVHLQN